jgi:hypothetical protein
MYVLPKTNNCSLLNLQNKDKMSGTRYVWRKGQIHTKLWLENMYNLEDKMKTGVAEPKGKGGGMRSHKIFNMGACLL